MHGYRSPHDRATIGLTDGLMTETDTECRHATSGLCDQLKANARLVGRARPWRKHDSLRAHGENVGEAQLVVAFDDDFRPELPQIVEEVVGKAVVVIDQEQQDAGASGNTGAFLRLPPRPINVVTESQPSPRGKQHHSIGRKSAICARTLGWRSVTTPSYVVT